MPPVALVVALLLVVVAHMLLGEMVPRNIALAGPERPRCSSCRRSCCSPRRWARPSALFNRFAQMVLRLLQVHPRDELEEAFTSGELAVMIAESRREGLLDDAESVRLTRTLQAADATVADVLVPRDELVSLPPQPCVGDVTAAVAATGFSRFPVRSPAGESWVGYLHVKDVLDLVDRRGRRRGRAGPPAAGARAARGGDHGPARRRGGRSCAPPAPTSPGPSTPPAPPSAWSPSKTWSRCSSAPCATQRTGRADRPLVGRSALPVVRSADGVVD